MKKIIIALCIVLGFATFSFAQVPTKTTQKTTVKKDSTAKHSGTTGNTTKTATTSTTQLLP